MHFNMFGALMEDGIRSNLNSTRVVCMEESRSSLVNPISANRPRSQTISEQAANMARYSDSVEDLETQSCFLLFQEIKESPRNIHQPVIERLVSGQPAQSASLYATRLIRDPAG